MVKDYLHVYCEEYSCMCDKCKQLLCDCLFVGMYADDNCPDDSKLFIRERHAFVDLLDGLKTPCSCGMLSHPWVLDSVVQVR